MKPASDGKGYYSLLLTLLGAILTAAVIWGGAQTQLTDTRNRVDTLEREQRTTNDTLIEVRQDVKWIRERLK